MYAVQSCGKAHPYCGVCRPEVSAKISAKAKARSNSYSIKSCGKAHASCNVCRPDVSVKWRAAVKRRTPEQRAKISAKLSAAATGRHLSDETRAKMSATWARRTPEQRAETRAKMSAVRLGVPKSDEMKARLSAARLGKSFGPASIETKALMSAAHKRHGEKCTGCGSAICNPTYENTSLERSLALLLSEFPTVELQRRFGRYRVDAYLPEYGLAFEADGHYWHRDKPGQPEKDAARDAEIMKRFNVQVVRLTETDLAATVIEVED